MMLGLITVVLFAGASCTSKPAGNYIGTDLRFSATMVWKPQAEFKDSPDGVTCSGIEIENLKLEGIEIPLESPTLSTDCFIRTTKYGAIQYRGNSPDPFKKSSVFFVTAAQEEQFRKLASGGEVGK